MQTSNSTVITSFAISVALIFAPNAPAVQEQELAKESLKPRLLKTNSTRDVIEAEGEVVASRKVDIRNQTDTELAILKLVPEGTVVEEGDFVLRFDSSLLEQQRAIARIEIATAETELRTHKTGLERTKDNFQLQRRVLEEKKQMAEMEAEYYLGKNGQLEMETRKLERNIVLLEKQKLLFEKLAIENSKSIDQQGDDQSNQANDSIESLKREIEILQLDNNIAESKLQLAHLQERARPVRTHQFRLTQVEVDARLRSLSSEFESEFEQLRSTVELKELQLKSTMDRLQELERQMEACEVRAPVTGAIHYSHQMGRAELLIEEGATIRAGQSVFFIPDMKKLQMKLLVSEGDINRIEPGQAATVNLDSFDLGNGDGKLAGAVSRVGNFPVVSWPNNSTRTYEVFVKLDGDNPDLRLGMRGTVKIVVD